MYALHSILAHVARRTDQREPAMIPNGECVIRSVQDGQLRSQRVRWRAQPVQMLPARLPEYLPEPLALFENGDSAVALAESGRVYLLNVHRFDCPHYAVYHEVSTFGQVVDAAAPCMIRSNPFVSLLTASGHIHRLRGRLYCGRRCSALSALPGRPASNTEISGRLWVRGTTQDWSVELVGNTCTPIQPANGGYMTGGETSERSLTLA